MKINSNEAYYILTNLDAFVSQFEVAMNKKMTPGARMILQELLLEASFPAKPDSESLH